MLRTQHGYAFYHFSDVRYMAYCNSLRLLIFSLPCTASSTIVPSSCKRHRVLSTSGVREKQCVPTSFQALHVLAHVPAISCALHQLLDVVGADLMHPFVQPLTLMRYSDDKSQGVRVINNFYRMRKQEVSISRVLNPLQVWIGSSNMRRGREHCCP